MVKNPPASAGVTGEVGLIPGWGRPPGGGNGNPLQSSCLGKPMDRGAWWATIHGVTKSQTHLSNCACLVAIRNHHKSGGFKRTEIWDFLGGPAVKTLRFLAGKLRSHILCGMAGAQGEPRSLFCHRSRGQKGKVTHHLGHDTSKGTCYLVTKSSLTLCDPVDCGPAGSSVHGISQARILEWVAIFSSRGSS